MNRLEKFAELAGQGVKPETVYRDLTQGLQESDSWDLDEDYETVIAYNSAQVESELEALRKSETGDKFCERFLDFERQYEEEHGSYGPSEPVYQHESGTVELLVSFNTGGANLLKGELDYYPFDPIWDSETEIATQFNEYAKNAVSSREAPYLESMGEPRDNNGNVASLRIPVDYDTDELERTWNIVDAASNQLSAPLSLSPRPNPEEYVGEGQVLNMSTGEVLTADEAEERISEFEDQLSESEE